MQFNMPIEDDFASFMDEGTGQAVFVDSFDNKVFEVRIGTVSDSRPVGSIIAAGTGSSLIQFSKFFH